MLTQKDTPYFDAMIKYVRDRVVPFHTPGHKQGGGTVKKFRDLIGEKALKLDLDIDDIEDYDNALRSAQKLTAEAYGADNSFFLVNGSTGGIHTMLLATCNYGDEIIVPRNAHKSVMSGIIMAGAVPVFIPYQIDKELHVPFNVEPEDVEKTIKKHPKAKVLIIASPTYYGLSTDTQEIVRIAHSYGKIILIDEAWGAHFKFHPDLPVSAMDAGADMCTNSTHKLLSGLTQSSMLHIKGNRVKKDRVKSMITLIQTTSPSCLLRASLDCTRMQMATEGKSLLTKAIRLAEKARNGINKIQGLRCHGKELVGKKGCYAMDPTRLIITAKELGYTGYDMEKILRKKYKIKVEMADLFNIVAIVSIGDTEKRIDYFLSSLADFASKEKGNVKKIQQISKKYRNIIGSLNNVPQQLLIPHQALFSPQKALTLVNSVGGISAELIVSYPPGIPLLLPGEKISEEVIDYIKIGMEAGMKFTGAEDNSLKTIKVVAD
ncbi:MAG: aminotransferase class I/II-fold pyridoxal phosphate-dependent enzyme [bacterium]|nr:aminotransferase class I/II-fold pyridoxal phosphate-dependent enzyme [bacterium]